MLFDLDGTLTDAAPGIVNCIRFALDDMGIDHPDDATMRTFLGPPLADTFGTHFGMDDDQIRVAIAKYRERYHDVGLYENAVYDGVPDVLGQLADAGMTLAIATSKPTYSATRILDHFGLSDRFTFIGGSDLEGRRHDKAAVIAHTLEELGARRAWSPDSGTLMVGDRRHDVEGAARHGISTIGVLWGYGSADELRAAGVELLVDSPRALATALLREGAAAGQA